MSAGPIPIRARRPISGKTCRTGPGSRGSRSASPPVFPVRAVAAMRCVLAADEQGKLVELARVLFEAYWRDLKDIGQEDVLREACRSAGLDPAAILARADAPDIKERLRANTEEVIARGGFGSPTMFVNGDDMYFGNDRLPLVEAALGGNASPVPPHQQNLST